MTDATLPALCSHTRPAMHASRPRLDRSIGPKLIELIVSGLIELIVSGQSLGCWIYQSISIDQPKQHTRTDRSRRLLLVLLQSYTHPTHPTPPTLKPATMGDAAPPHPPPAAAEEAAAAPADAAAAAEGGEEEYRVMAERMKDEGNAAFKAGK